MITSKFIIFLSIVLVAYVGAEHQYCPDTGISYLTHYSNCSLFFECNEGIKILMECPFNYSWAWYDNKCELKDWVDCSFTTLTPPPTTTTTTTPNPVTLCPSWGFSYLPNYIDCHQYFECNNGVELALQCPTGKAWSPELQACDLEENVDCSYTTLAPTASTLAPGECPSNGQAYLPNYLDCTSFYSCENGARALRKCPTGYAWDENLEACNVLANVDCSYTTGTGTTPTTPTTSTSPGTSTSSTKTTPTTSIQTTSSPANNLCEGQTNGAYLPHPYDCTKFVECMNNNAFTIDCPAGTSWDQNVKQCDNNNDENCKNSTVKPTTTTTTTPVTTITTTRPTTPSNDWCAGQTNGAFLPHPYDCTKFLECMDEHAYTIDCPAGKSWDQKLRQCNDNNDENCKNSTVVPTTTTTTTPVPTTVTTRPTTPANDWCVGQTNGAFLPHPYDCTKFLECMDEHAYIIDCPAGTSWDQKFKQCNDNNEENCKNSTVVPTTTTTTTPVPTTVTTRPTTPANDWCVGQTNGAYLPHPYDCTKFLECMDEHAYVIDCPAGKSWDQKLRQCNDNNDENCKNSTVIPTTTTTTTPVPTTVTTRPTTPANDWCVGQTNGAYLPHPYDCTKFLECMDEHAYVIDCSAGTSWDQKLRQCNDNNDENCKNSTVIPTTTTTTTPVPTTITTRSTTPANDWCVGQTNGAFLPHPYDCTKFLECMDEHAYVVVCASGESWDQNKKMCDTNNDENCKYTSVSPTASSQGPTHDPLCPWPSDAATYYPHPYNCSLFYECEAGVRHLLECETGYLWDVNKNECNLAENVDCSYTSTTPASTTPSGNICNGQPDGTFLPYPNDCTRYVYCENGISFTNICRDGTSWDDSAKQCNNNPSNCQ